MKGYRYGAYDDGPDPLAAPYDVARAVDELGDAVLDGAGTRDALRELLRRGADGLHGLDDLLRQVRRQQRQLRRSGRLDGTLEEVRRLLDQAIGQERAALFPDPSDDARVREAELDALPPDTARAVRELADYDWRSADARATYEQIRDLLRREVLDRQFRGMKQALENADPDVQQRVRDMLADLNTMLEADARGEHTQADFDAFMDKYGDFFPEQPANLEELVDQLARRAAAAERMMRSLTPEQRAELEQLAAQALGDLDLAAEMARLNQSLQSRRPDMFGRRGRERMTGQTPLGLGDATTTLEELADLDALEETMSQEYAGATLDDVDEGAVQRALGRQAVDDLDQLKRLERELERQGYLVRRNGELELSPKAVRRIGQTALRRVFASLDAPRRGDHDVHDAGAAGEVTGASREWRFGDEQPLDVVRTVRNAVVRSAPTQGRIPLQVEDFEVVETERRTSAAVCLLVDLSYSMVLNGTWAPAKQTALALHALITGMYPQDALQVIGFSNMARVLQPTELAGVEWEMVQGTNLQHALMMAGRFLERHNGSEPVVLVVTDGEPTAHLLRDGRHYFDWPPAPETLELTLAEVDRMTRRGATINVFMLGDDPRLVDFVTEVARRNGGRVFSPSADTLGDYVVADFLRTRRALGRPRRAS
ncbi:MAG: hypothetical protein ABWZ26_01680 [Candidatus Nanopelagicales bacterium]